jgi:hypothetical protein
MFYRKYRDTRRRGKLVTIHGGGGPANALHTNTKLRSFVNWEVMSEKNDSRGYESLLVFIVLERA